MPDDQACQKRTYYFVNNDRSMLSAVSLDREYTIPVEDSRGAGTRLSFRVTRNAYLGTNVHWIYGQVLNPATDYYEQVEIRLRKDHPEYDTIEIFPMAPPVTCQNS